MNIATSIAVQQKTRMKSTDGFQAVSPAGSESAVKGADSRKWAEVVAPPRPIASDLELLSDRSSVTVNDKPSIETMRLILSQYKIFHNFMHMRAKTICEF